MNETCRNNSEDQHEVVLNHAFLISEVEVTRTQFESVMLHPPSAPRYACGAPSNETCPEGPVSWQEAVAYCNKLSDMEQFAQCYVLASVAGVCASCPGDSGCVNGVCVTVTVSPSFRGGNSTIYDCPGYRLPTEAEWEYAYRAGTSTPYYNGPSDPAGCPKNEAGAVVCGPEYAVASDIAWWCRNSGSKLHEVGQKLPNGWGLHDLAGNAREWVHDGYVPHLGSLRQTDPVVDPTLTTPMAIVQRGGSSGTGSHALRAASRTFSAPVLPNILPTPQGFRCARTLEP
jgi:formylglycine-generating enzyme required for sulfatase activity